MKNLIVLVAMVMTIGVLFAQPPKGQGQGQKGERMHEPPSVEQMQKDLDLTDEQVVQLQQLRMKGEKERAAMQKQKEANREKMKEAHESRKAAFEAILTPEQLEKLKTIRAERPKPENGSKGCQGHGQKGQSVRNGERMFGSSGVEQLQKDLDLTDGQVVQLQQLRVNREKEKAANREKMKEAHESGKAAFEAILTPEQLVKLETIRVERPKPQNGQKGKKGHHGAKGECQGK